MALVHALIALDTIDADLTLSCFCTDSLPFGILPGGETVTMLIKKIAALNCVVFVAIAQILFGLWKPGKDPLGSHLKSK